MQSDEALAVLRFNAEQSGTERSAPRECQRRERSAAERHGVRLTHDAERPEASPSCGRCATRSFMTRKAENLLEAALKLPQTERAALASALLRSLDEDDSAVGVDEADIEAAWAEELRRRADDLRSGRVATVPWDQVKADLEARIRRGP